MRQLSALFLLVVLNVTAPAAREERASPPAVVVPDLSGTWVGADWGTVTLRHTSGGRYVGTYTGTYGRHVGRIVLWPSAEAGRYDGSWGEGDFRFGQLVVRVPLPVRAVEGSYGADPKCRHQPGLPARQGFSWKRAAR